MKTILSTYDLDRDRITMDPFVNPLSSYFYVIDDAYQAKLSNIR